MIEMKKRENEEKNDSDNYIPFDLMEQVFSRLPVKSLLRFRTVSKNWRDSISSPSLTTFHLQSYIHNKINEYLTFRILTFEKANDDELHINIRYIDTFNKPSLLMKLSSSYKPCADLHGLVLMSNDITKELILINPSVRKSLELPTCPMASNDTLPIIYLIGFSSKVDDYKIVAIQFGHSFASLTLKDRCWKINEMKLDPEVDYNGLGILLNNEVAYWFASNGSIVGFDFDDERFRIVGKPDVCREIYLSVLDFDGSDAVMLNVSTTSFVVWSMRKIRGEMQWIKVLSEGSNFDAYKLFQYKSPGYRTWFIEKKCMIYRFEDGKLWSYDVKSHQKVLLGEITKYVFHVGTFVESLVLC